MKDLNIKLDTIKFLAKNIGRVHFDINYSSIFLDPPPSVIKKKANKLDLINLKSFCTAKEIVSKMKRQPAEWENIFAKEVTDKVLISKTFSYAR